MQLLQLLKVVDCAMGVGFQSAVDNESLMILPDPNAMLGRKCGPDFPEGVECLQFHMMLYIDI